MSQAQHRPCRFLFVLFAAASGCAPRLAPLPSGPGTPAANYAEAYSEASASCRGIRTLSVSLGLSGRAGDTPLRGRIDAGFASPGQIRLEGSPPMAFGRPLFILVGRQSDATLLLPRDKRVLTDARAEAIIERLAGVALSADELRAVVSGCGFGFVEPQEGRSYGDGWMAVTGAEGTSWLRNRDGEWRLNAAVREPLEIRYEAFASQFPARIRIRTTPSSAGPRADIVLKVADVDANIELGPEVFRVEIPDDAAPITLEELSRALSRGDPDREASNPERKLAGGESGLSGVERPAPSRGILPGAPLQ